MDTTPDDCSDIAKVQKRPGMYVGTLDDGVGLHNLLYELIRNAAAEGIAGYCTTIKVLLNADGSATVQDNGRGIPLAILPGFAHPVSEIIFTHIFHDCRMHATIPKYEFMYGIGLCVVNALSEKLDVSVVRGEKKYTLQYRAGKLGTPSDPHAIDTLQMKRGTQITFLPSAKFFANRMFDFDRVSEFISKLQPLQTGIEVSLSDCREGKLQEQAIQI